MCRSNLVRLAKINLSKIGACLFVLCSGWLAAEKATAQTRIMPLGNSITSGVGSTHGGGYRFYLYELLSQDEEFGPIDFVGQLRNGSGFPDIDHEGYPGFKSTDLNVEDYLRRNPADIVLLEIGTNETDRPPQTVSENIAFLVDRIHTKSPDTKIYLSTVIPRLDGEDADTDQLNALLPAIVDARFSPDYQIFLADINERFKSFPDWQNELMADNLHPNDLGYELMAEEWYGAITNRGVPGKLAEFTDEFDRASLGPDWTAHEAYDIRNAQLVNTSPIDAWNNFFAICNVVTSVEIAELTYGSLSDVDGRSFTGLAMMLTKSDLDASGYLIFHNYNQMRLWTIENGVPTEEIASVGGLQRPQADDVIRAEVKETTAGYQFSVYQNEQLVAVLNDPLKRYNGSYAGVIINGNTQNAVENFYCANLNDNRAPAAVADLRAGLTGFSLAVLQWTAPGNDGHEGRAAGYQIRYSTNNILSEADFEDATPVKETLPPGLPGAAEQLTASDLESGTTYYFALKAFDNAGNVSGLSNVVSATTSILSACQDNFNRPNGSLGENWNGDLTSLQIRDNRVLNVAVGDIWSPAVFRECRNVVEVTMKYGPEATSYGINFSGILLMADAPTATPSGYMIQRFNGDTPGVVERGRTRLWLVQNGRPVTVIDEGPSQNPLAPGPNSKITVRIAYENGSRYFYVYVDDVFDRILADPQNRFNGLYAGFLLESTLGEQNAVDEFISGIGVGGPKLLTKISGDNQIGPIGQPLPLPLTVSLIDSFDNPLSNALVKFALTSGAATIAPPPSKDGALRLEAEEANFNPPIQSRNDSQASGGKFIVYPDGQTLDASATFTFQITRAGVYRIWTRSLKTGVEPGSWTISVDGGADFVYDVFQNSTSSAWTWDLMSDRGNGPPVKPQFDPKLFNFSAGTHTVIFKARWADTRLDKILITDNGNLAPSGKEESGFVTDAKGIASAVVTLGDKAGIVAIQASYRNVPPVTFTATATGGVASTLAMNGGAGQSGSAGQTLPQPFKVMVQDSRGNEVAGQRIFWVVTNGNGTLSEYASISDINGIAATTLTLGNASAGNAVEARAAFTNTPVIFTATTISGVAGNAAVASGNSQTGTVHAPLSAPLVAKVTTTTGQAVPNFPVEFRVRRGGGALSPNFFINNEGFELANSGANTPANWTLEGGAVANEVLLSTTGPRGGLKSLQINTARDGIGVSQAINYPAAGNYTLNFYAKVISGTARVTWRLNDATGNPIDKTIDIAPAATGTNWTLYTISASNGSIPQAGRSLSFKSFGGAAGFFIDDAKIMRNTDGNGQIAVNWTLGDTAGTQTVQAEIKAGAANLAGSPLIFSATASPAIAKKILAASGNNQSGSAGQTLSAPLVIKVADEFGNGIPNRSVNFTVKAGGGKLNGNLNSVAAKTNSNGLAQASLKLGPTSGDTNKVEVTSTGLSSVLFKAIAITPSKVTKLPAPSTGSAGQRLAQPLIVRVVDVNDKKISGYPVHFKIQQGNGKINDSTQVVVHTDSTGEARGRLLLGPTPGASNRVEAWVTNNGNILPSPALAFIVTAARLKQLAQVSGNNQTGTACDPLAQPFKIKVLDSLGVGIKNQPVIFRVTRGGGKLNGSDTIKTVLTDSLGIAQIKLTLGAKPGTNQVSTTTPGLNGSSQTFTATGRAGHLSALNKVSGDSLFGLIHTALPAPQVVRVVDKCGNGIANAEVKFAVKAGGGKVNGKDLITVETDASGKAQVSWKLGLASGGLNNRLEARAFNGQVELTNSPLIFVASATATAARAIKAAGVTSFTGRTGMTLASALVVKVTDGIGGTGNAVQGHPVKFQVVRGGGLFANGRADTTVITGAGGSAQVRWTLGGAIGKNSQEVRATASNTGVLLEGSPVNFVASCDPGQASAEGSEVIATSPIPADGIKKSNVTIYVRDRFGNPLRGEAVTVVVSPSGNHSIDQPAGLTDDQGKVTAVFASTSAGTKTIIARVLDGVDITPGATVEVMPLAAQNLSLVSGNNQTCNVQAAIAKPLRVKVSDRHGNGVPNHVVGFTIPGLPGAAGKGNGRIYEPAPIRTDDNGFASATFVGGTSAGQSQIWAESTSLPNSTVIFLANVVQSAPHQLQEISGNVQSSQAGQILPIPIAVRVVDKSGRPVFGVPVKLDVTYGGGAIDNRDPLNANTNELGEVRASWRLGPASGSQTLRVESKGLVNSPLDFRAEAIAGFAENIVPFSGQNGSGEVGKTMQPGLCVMVTDANGNGVDNMEVLFELIDGTGSFSSLAAPMTVQQILSDNGGFACVQLTFGKDAGPRRVRASAAGLRGSPIDFYVYGEALPPQSMKAIERTNNQRGTKGKPLNFPLQILVQDRLGNPVRNEAINFLVTSGGGDFNGSNPLVVLTDSSGIASAPWTLGRSAAANEASAVSLRAGVQPSTIVFKATGFDNNFPLFEEVPDRRVTEGDAIEFLVRAVEPDGERMTYGAKNLPRGAQFDSLTNRIFRWRTDLNSAGHYEVSFLAADGKGGVDEEVVIIDVKNRNQPPEIMSRFPVGLGIPTQLDTVIDFNTALPMRVTARDADGESLRYRWFLNGKFAGSTTNTFLLRSNERFNTVEVLVFDREDTASTTWSIKVPVKLSSFSVALAQQSGTTASGKPAVTLEWQTSSEVNNAGFNVLRSSASQGRYQKINPELIAARRDGHYVFIDDKIETGRRYFYKLEDVDGNGQVTLHGPVEIEVAAPKSFALQQNFPNPFSARGTSAGVAFGNPTTQIHYDLPRPALVTLTIYNALGQEIRKLVDGQQPAGFHLAVWNGRDEQGKPVPSGVYHYRLQAGDFIATKKMLMAK